MEVEIGDYDDERYRTIGWTSCHKYRNEHLAEIFTNVRVSCPLPMQFFSRPLIGPVITWSGQPPPPPPGPRFLWHRCYYPHRSRLCLPYAGFCFKQTCHCTRTLEPMMACSLITTLLFRGFRSSGSSLMLHPWELPWYCPYKDTVYWSTSCWKVWLYLPSMSRLLIIYLLQTIYCPVITSYYWFKSCKKLWPRLHFPVF